MPVLVESSIRAAMVAVSVAVILYGLRIVSARTRHRAWCAVLAAMLLLPAFSIWGPKLTLRVLPERAGDSRVAVGEPIDLPSAGAVDTERTAGASATPPSRLPLLWIAYFAVGGVLLLRLVYGAARAAAICRFAAREDGFLSSDECACPITIGWWRAEIVLPRAWRGWSAGELDAILAHERAHVRRRDPLVQWLAALNRCVFWFHPLAWWLEHRLSALAEEACDVAAVAAGHDPRDYSEYLIRQARAVQRAGARVPIHGAAIGGGTLDRRIRRLLDPRPAPVPSGTRGLAGAVLCTVAIAAFTACSLGRVEKAAPGQPSMNELAQRRAQSNQQYMDHQQAILSRARSLTREQARELFTTLQQKPDDADAFWTLVRHYEFQVNVKDLSALRLWYIEHQPAGKIAPGNIDPRIDRASYDKGKALWLAHLKQPGASADMYQRAADYLDGGDKALAETVLENGRNAYPGDARWPSLFGRHYAQVLIGSDEPVTEYNVVRKVSAAESSTPYAQRVRVQLAESRDVNVLAQTAQYMLVWGRSDAAGMQQARTLLERAASIEPESAAVRSLQLRLGESERLGNLERLRKMPPAELAAAPAGDRMLLAWWLMRESAMRQKFEEAEAKARELLEIAGKNTSDSFYGDAVFEGHTVMGKAALHRGDRQEAARHLLAAADTPGSARIRRGDFEMNLPRALVDWGERRAVADFYRRMAPKTTRSKQFEDWAAEITKGVNPDLLPTFSAPGCTQAPC